MFTATVRVYVVKSIVCDVQKLVAQSNRRDFFMICKIIGQTRLPPVAEFMVKWKTRSAECGVRSVENAECGKRGVWKIRSVENAECRKCGVWKMRSVENAECRKCGVWKMRSVKEKYIKRKKRKGRLLVISAN